MPLQTNYGGIFQIMALQAFLQENGHMPIIINRLYSESTIKRFLKIFFEKNRIIDYKKIGFRRRSVKKIELFKKEQIKEITIALYTQAKLKQETEERNFDSIIVGSDQVWNPYYMRDLWKNAFLDFVRNHKTKKIAYAASFGNDIWNYPEKTDVVKSLIGEFDAVSVREKSGMSICETEFNYKNVQHVVDPTLLVDVEFYEKYIQKNENEGVANGIFTYMLNHESGYEDIYLKARTELKLPLYSLIVNSEINDSNENKDYLKPSPKEWITLLINSKFVITDSYHGTLFSIIFKKSFISIENEKRGISRLKSFLRKLDLEERLIFKNQSFDPDILNKGIDYDKVYSILNPWIDSSKKFLLNSLD